MAQTPDRAGPTLITAAATSQTIYTAPSGGTNWAILRTILVASEVTDPVTFTIGVGTSNVDAAGKRLTYNTDLTQGQTWEWSGYLPLLGGGPDLVYALCSVAGGVTVTVGVVEGP